MWHALVINIPVYRSSSGLKSFLGILPRSVCCLCARHGVFVRCFSCVTPFALCSFSIFYSFESAHEMVTPAFIQACLMVDRGLLCRAKRVTTSSSTNIANRVGCQGIIIEATPILDWRSNLLRKICTRSAHT